MSTKKINELKKRLEKDKSLLQKYDDVIKGQLELGIIEEVGITIAAGEETYIPHREVIREDHVSTKLHVVFDCSAKCGNDISLNGSLYKGPCLNPHLFDLFNKFCLFPIAVTATIKKAYF